MSGTPGIRPDDFAFGTLVNLLVLDLSRPLWTEELTCELVAGLLAKYLVRYPDGTFDHVALDADGIVAAVLAAFGE